MSEHYIEAWKEASEESQEALNEFWESVPDYLHEMVVHAIEIAFPYTAVEVHSDPFYSLKHFQERGMSADNALMCSRIFASNCSLGGCAVCTDFLAQHPRGY